MRRKIIGAIKSVKSFKKMQCRNINSVKLSQRALA